MDTAIHDIGPDVEPSGNQYAPATFTPTYVWNNYPCATNCLIANIDVPSGAMFLGVANSAKPSSLVNCTIVSNSFVNMFSYYANSAYAMTAVNCIFYGNRKVAAGVYSDCDLSIDTGNSNSNGVRISSSAYGTAGISSFADFIDGSVYKIGAADGVGESVGMSPGFCGPKDPSHPYALRHASHLRGLGVVQNWMADAYDLRGEGYPRLRDGRVDLGCYQCWLKPTGTIISFY